jgi:hypothetical protein
MGSSIFIFLKWKHVAVRAIDGVAQHTHWSMRRLEASNAALDFAYKSPSVYGSLLLAHADMELVVEDSSLLETPQGAYLLETPQGA